MSEDFPESIESFNDSKRIERIRAMIERLEKEKEELKNRLMKGEITFYQYYHAVRVIERRIRRLEEKLYGL